MTPRGRLEVREYDILSWVAEGVGDAGVSTDAVGDGVPADAGSEAPEGGPSTDVDAKIW